MSYPGHIKNRISDTSILVIGDSMLDRYLFGSVQRLSPEAPVPVVKKVSCEDFLGGAGRVAQFLAKFSQQTGFVTIVGSDDAAKILANLCKKNNIRSTLFQENQRKTTMKIRILGNHQHVVRVDDETEGQILSSSASKIMRHLQKIIPKSDIVIISDYNKGLINLDIASKITYLARKFRKPLFVDSKRSDPSLYQGAKMFTPNAHEASKLTGFDVVDDTTAEKASQFLLKRYGFEMVMITRASQGLTLTAERW